MVLARRQQLCQSALWIIEVAEINAMRRAHRRARGSEPFFDPVHAKRAFVGIALRVASPGKEAFVDAVQLEEGAEVTDYTPSRDFAVPPKKARKGQFFPE